MAAHRLRPAPRTHRGGDRTGPFGALGTGKNLRADEGTSQSRSYPTRDRPGRGAKRKGASAMAKMHARPSNQYRYEHYDPRF